MLKNLEGKTVEKDTEAAYPPILDTDPVFAARFLCKEDLDIFYIVLERAFRSICSKEPCDFHILIDSIMYSKENLDWFMTFYKEMEILKGEDYSYFKLPIRKFKGNGLEFQPPFYVDKNNKIYYEKIRIKSKNPIIKHRVEYIRRGLDVTAFRDGYPAWYSFNDTTVFEHYDENSNVRVRIDFNNGEFLYYICGASDNWQRLQEVPLEVDYIISALLFRS